MNKKELIKNIEAWTGLFSDDYDFKTHWYLYTDQVDILAKKNEENKL